MAPAQTSFRRASGRTRGWVGNGCQDALGNAVSSSGELVSVRVEYTYQTLHAFRQFDPRLGAPQRLGHHDHKLGETDVRESSHRRQHGQALALFALALTAIVLGVAVVVDGGYAYAQRRVAQNAADFAAMAGTRIVGVSLTGRPAGSGSAANVVSAVNSTLAANDATLVSARYVDNTGADLGNVVGAGAIPAGAFGVVVNARTDWKPFLLGVIGIKRGRRRRRPRR